MRQVGSLPDQREAERFAAYLVTQGIDAHAEQDTHNWAVWVRDEDRIDQARESLEHFKGDPEDHRYRGVERDAEVIRRGEFQRRVSAQKNVVEMRSRWRQPSMRRAPLTMTVIVLSVLVTLMGNFGKAQRGIGRTMNQQLTFCTPADYVMANKNPLASLAKGEVWRAITPVFLHLSPLHLAFNMIMFFQFGALFESLKGTVRLGLLMLVIAVVSNIGQAVAPSAWGGTFLFGGMSGVVYGLFGYAWVKSTFVPEPGFHVSQGTVLILVGWLILCMTPAIPNIANVAHVVGLVVGMTLAYVPSFWQR
ncbi:MAG: rhomboid family intramembrane serine protease [Pirellulaceae bacterium]